MKNMNIYLFIIQVKKTMKNIQVQNLPTLLVYLSIRPMRKFGLSIRPMPSSLREAC